MSKEKVISIWVDKNVKKEFETICESIGLSNSDAINIFIRKVINEKGIPFPVRLNKESQ